MKIATLGPQGTYSEEAARLFAKHLKNNGAVEIIFTSVRNSLRLVQNTKADFAVVPVENMIDGLIGSTFDALIEFQDFVKVCDEIHLPIAHALAARSDTDWDSLRKIYSHPSALNQCQDQLETLFPETVLIPVSSTAEAVQKVLRDPSNQAAAICNPDTAIAAGMQIFKGQIQDYPDNETRFLVCSQRDGQPTGKDRTLLAVRYGANQPGQLFQTAQYLAEEKIDLTFVQSRPYKIKPREYVLIFEFEGHKVHPNVERALKKIEFQIRATGGWKKILGSYPRREREILNGNQS